MYVAVIVINCVFLSLYMACDTLSIASCSLC